jgi:hypothetical protein
MLGNHGKDNNESWRVLISSARIAGASFDWTVFRLLSSAATGELALQFQEWLEEDRAGWLQMIGRNESGENNDASGSCIGFCWIVDRVCDSDDRTV